MTLTFKKISIADAVVGKRYLANIEADGLIFGNFYGFDNHLSGEAVRPTTHFHNEGYGYMDADSWPQEQVLALYEIPESDRLLVVPDTLCQEIPGGFQ